MEIPPLQPNDIPTGTYANSTNPTKPNYKPGNSSISKDTIIAIVGLGYVGLPLAVEFGKKYRTIGYDLSETKITNYKNYRDPTGEVSTENLKASTKLTVSTDPKTIGEADVIVVAVPTPVDKAHIPDFSSLMGASAMVGKHMKPGTIIIYESTVYPGATEEICIPLLEKSSSMEWKRDFHVGYSPERVNPGDKKHTITKIVKIVSGDDKPTLKLVSDLYASIITAGVHRATSIKVAEAAKVIENTQRDLNIALMNELSIIFDHAGINTSEVLRAAETKWNFLPFRPGLVGGHCIGVDPYYLTYKAEILGYDPQIILAGRHINDGMAVWIAQQTIKQMIKNGSTIRNSKIIVLGLTFKENCADLRNSKVVDLIKELQCFGCNVAVHDPVAASEEATREYSIPLTHWNDLPIQVEAIVVAVPHRKYLTMSSAEITTNLKKGGIFIDIKSAYDPEKIATAGFKVWSL